jgi:hypothetical protein
VDKDLLDWSTIASAAGTVLTAFMAGIAIPMALRQQREARLGTLESNVMQLLLSYLDFRPMFKTLQIVETGKDGTVTSTDFNEGKVELCVGHLDCAVSSLVTLVSDRHVEATRYRTWAETLLKDTASLYYYLVSSATSAAIDVRNWRQMVPVERLPSIERLVADRGAGLTAEAMAISKMAVKRGATEESFREVMGADTVETLVAFRVYIGTAQVRDIRRLSWETVKFRNRLQVAFRGIGADLLEWDIDHFIPNIDSKAPGEHEAAE